MDLIAQTARDFADVFADSPAAWSRAPGRVEVLGNHTDYNEGFILSAAIDRHVVICGRRIDGDTAKIYSRTFNAGDTINMNEPQFDPDSLWSNYPAGVVQQLLERGIKIGAFEALVTSDVPLGAGLSSSAALEVATAHFLKQLFPFEMEPVDIALTCQAAENKFVGVNCGILDQFSSQMGKKDHLIFLDCRDLARYDHFPLGTEVELVLANTHARHELADGTYNRLRKSCFKAAEFFDKVLDKPVTHLRDVTMQDFEAHGSGLDPAKMKRARHVIGENERVLAGIDALKKGDLDTMGRMMLESHASSRDDFGNSCRELDVMVDLARELPGCYGCRLSGGGFGGCTVNLVKAGEAKAFAEALGAKYKEATGIDSDMHICKAVDGACGGVL